MSHQGNVCLGYHLVLSVAVRISNLDSKTLSKKIRQSAKTFFGNKNFRQKIKNIIKNAVHYHANTDCIDICDAVNPKGECFLIACEEKYTTYADLEKAYKGVSETYVEPIQTVLKTTPEDKKLGNVVILFGSYDPQVKKSKKTFSYEKKREQCENDITGNNQLVAYFRKFNPHVVVENFCINISYENIELIKNSKHNAEPWKLLYIHNTQPFWHLGRRVRTAFTEHTHEIYSDVSGKSLQSDTQHYCHRTIGNVPNNSNKETHSCALNSTKASKNFLPPNDAVRKILDIRDAIDIVCEGLDGGIDFFPPVPRPLQTIFEGKANTDDSVRIRYKFPFGVWFRGAGRVCHGLEPSLFRENRSGLAGISCKGYDKPPTMYEESSMVHHFMLNKPQLRHENHDIFEWLCLMQHYDMPSRMLDWSENILTALYFAVASTESDKMDCDGMIWALNSARLNEITHIIPPPKRTLCVPDSIDVLLRSVMAISHSRSDFIGNLQKMKKYEMVVAMLNESDFKDNNFIKWLMNTKVKKNGKRIEISSKDIEDSPTYQKLAYPIAVLPFRINERQAFQQAAFTLCGGKQYDDAIRRPSEELPAPVGLIELSRQLARRNKNDQIIPQGAKPFLEMFIVPSCAKRKIREQLKRIGVHSGTLYPELDKQAWYLRHQWRLGINKSIKY